MATAAGTQTATARSTEPCRSGSSGGADEERIGRALTVIVPVPAAANVRTPAVSDVADAGAPVPEMLYVVFGSRSETYSMVAPDAG